ncbi:MAG: hypothetical protein VX460_08170, partial [Planctomycetota bacterium]|nr:hypothetical protein [Planctomycetota bacterium]
LWLLFMYGADRLLQLPAPIRLIHLALLAAGTAWLLARTLLRHRRAVPDRAGLALLAQRALPAAEAVDDRFINALELTRTVDPATPAAELVERIAASAEESAGRIDLGRVTDGGRPARRFTAGAVCAAVTLAALGSDPALARIFGARMLGADVAWPRATTLFLEVPADTTGLEVDTSDPERIVVRAARGRDVPLLVRAEGVVPELVSLSFDSGAIVDLGPSGPDTFRTVLPSVQEDLGLVVTGGDDDRGVPRVEIVVLQPPDLARLAFVVSPPAYSGLPREVSTETRVSALQGSTVEVFVQADPASATGVARTFPDGIEIPLDRALFPAEALPTAGEASEESAEAPAPSEALSFRTTAIESTRFRFELRDETGLENPDPALFGIEVVPDRAPELITLEPGRADVEVVVGGAAAMRILGRDDFGVRALERDVATAATETAVTKLALELAEVELEDSQRGRRGEKDTRLASRLLEIDGFFPEGPPAIGTSLVLTARLTDSRQPDANVTEAAPIRLRVVSADEFLRRQRDGLGRAAAEVTEVTNAVDRTADAVEGFVLGLSGDDRSLPDAAGMAQTLNDVRRVRGDLESVSRDLSGLASSLIYSRLDERSGALEARLFELTRSSADRAFLMEAWRTLGEELRAGRLGAPASAGALVGVVALAIEAADLRCGALIAALEEARGSDSTDTARQALVRATIRVEELRAALEELGLELSEWDSMQSIQALAREILNSQKNLAERTRKQAQQGTSGSGDARDEEDPPR